MHLIRNLDLDGIGAWRKSIKSRTDLKGIALRSFCSSGSFNAGEDLLTSCEVLRANARSAHRADQDTIAVQDLCPQEVLLDPRVSYMIEQRRWAEVRRRSSNDTLAYKLEL